jgi:hypothetical protein
MHWALAAEHIWNRSSRALELRIHQSARALQVWGIAARSAILRIAIWYR